MENYQGVLTTTEHIQPPDSVSAYQRAGFWMRLWAYLIDLIVIGSLSRLLVNPIFKIFDISLADTGVFSPYIIVDSVLFFGYFVLTTKFLTQTLGKMVMGLRVVSLNGEPLVWSTLIFREWIGRYISAVLMLGYIVIAFNPKKQGFHDMFSDTVVVLEDRKAI